MTRFQRIYSLGIISFCYLVFFHPTFILSHIGFTFLLVTIADMVYTYRCV